MPALLALEKSLVRKYDQISKMQVAFQLFASCFNFFYCRCDYNKYTLQYISTLGEVFSKKSKAENMEVGSDEEEVDESDISDNNVEIESDRA